MKKLFAAIAFALVSCSAFAQGPGFPTPTPRKTATPTATAVVGNLPSTFAATTQAAVLHEFRMEFFTQFGNDALALNGWSAPTGLTGFSAIDPDPNVAVTKLVQFLVILRRNNSGLFDLLVERHDSGMAKIGQAFAQANGNVRNAADYTMETQGVSRSMSTDKGPANNQAAGIDPVAFLQVSWCDVAPDVAYAAFLKVKPQLAAAGIPQRPFPCAIPTPTPTSTPAPTATATATPSPSPSLTPTATPPGGFLVTINCAGCAPATYSAPASGVTITIAPK